MCGRMTLTRSANEIAEYFALEMAGELLSAKGAPWTPRYNVAPTQDIPAIRLAGARDDRTRVLEWKRWGLVPSWAKDPSIGTRLFNARSETVATKPSFRSAYQRRRCLVVADGFYEWTPRNRDHQPHYFEPTRGPFLAMAGLFESWVGEGGEVIDSCTVLTTDANSDVSDVHHRMPVLIEPSAYDHWMDPDTLAEDLSPLLASAPVGSLKKRKVGRKVGNARFDDPSCIAEASATTQSTLFTFSDESGGPSRV